MKMYTTGDKCECCGGTLDTEAKVRSAAAYEAPEGEGPEVEVSVEGDPESVRALLEKLVPAKED